METFPPSQLPPQRCRSHPYSFVSVFSFFFCPTQVHADFLAFWESEVFCQCSVGVVPHIDVFLMCLWEEGDLHVLPLHHLEGLLSVFWYFQFSFPFCIFVWIYDSFIWPLYRVLWHICYGILIMLIFIFLSLVFSFPSFNYHILLK